MPKPVLIDRDLGWKKRLESITQAGDAFVRVGIQQDEVREVAEGDDDPIDMVRLAAIHEFGAEKAGKSKNVTIPERPFVRGWHDSAKSQIERLQDKLMRQFIDGKITMRLALKKLGVFGQGGMRKFLRDLKQPALAASTVRGRKKGTRGKNKGVSSDNPLVDTGQLLASIHYVSEIRGQELDSGATA